MTSAQINVHRSKRKAKGEWVAKPVAVIPAPVKMALREAMKTEGMSETSYADLLWIVAQESGGKVGARNPGSTARGLFQLLRAQYSLNPNGEKSFGNAVEECQGGIRYIQRRYRGASAARMFWKRHHWY